MSPEYIHIANRTLVINSINTSKCFVKISHVKNPTNTITEIIINGNKSINFDTDEDEPSIYNDNNYTQL